MSSYNKITLSTLTHKYIVDNYLKGVPLVDRTGNPFPGTTIQTHINNALSATEHLLHIPLKRKVIKSNPVDAGLTMGTDYDEMIERLPYNRDNARNFFQIKLPHSNIISIERIRGFLESNTSHAISISTDYVVIAYPKNGTIHIKPMGSVLGIIGGGFSLSNTQRFYEIMNYETFPGFWAIDYTIGPFIGSRSSGNLGGEFKDGVFYLDDMIGEYVCKKAAITILNMASTANKPGIASQSVAVDGFSRSTSYTSSATYALYSAHIEEYRKDLKDLEPELLKHFKPIRIQ